MTLRLRVVLAAAGGVLLAVAGLAVAAQFLVRNELHHSQDRGLRSRATDIARLSVSAPALLTSPSALDAPGGGEQLLVEVLDRHQRVVARSGALGGRLLPADRLVRDAIAGGHSGYGHARFSGAPSRLFVAPLPDAGGPAAGGAVIVAATEVEIDRTADRVRTLILLCALGAAALGAAITAALTGRGLAPLRRLSAAATDIERRHDAALRLPEAAGGREIGELTQTLNAMLASLEQAHINERRFLADASHELRTPVTALRGNIEFVARHGADPETIADLRSEAERLSRLVDNLLALERQTQSGGVGAEHVELGGLARAIATAHSGAVSVRAADPVTVVGDPDALRRTIENLVTNALWHGAEPVVVSVWREGGRARLSVSDAGPGLDPEHADVAFGRFWRGPDSRARGGSGLGLAIVRDTARSHGGDVEVSGATFTLDLPAAPASGKTVRDPSETGPTVGEVPPPAE